MPETVMRAAEAFGLDARLLRRMGGNSGSAWSAGEKVVRIGRREMITREVLASSAAEAVVPVPRIVDRVELDDISAVLLTRLPGRPAAELARLRPQIAPAIGQACGAIHASLAEVAAPAALRAVSDARRRLPQTAHMRVLHLDLHPFNVLVDEDGGLTGVLDWANAAAGDPVLDRARSWTILMLDPAVVARHAEPGWTALVEGWVESGGLRGVPPTPRAWACRFMLADLATRHPADKMEHIAHALAQAEAAEAAPPGTASWRS